MWTPPFNRMPEEDLRPMVAAIGAAELITVGADGYPIATRLPVVWREDVLRFHMAVANPQWRELAEGDPAVAVVTGPEAYVTPSWYADKHTHGRVVPTWNYTAIQFRGRVRVFRDLGGLRDTVTELTDHQESRRAEPWAVTDAPDTFVDQQLRAIVGVDIRIEAITARAKRSQNRTTEDRRSVIEGLGQGTAMERAVAEQMAADLAGQQSPGR